MKLKEYLLHENISQSSFAAMVGVSQGFISQVIAGKYKPRGSRAIDWSRATKWLVTPHDLNSEDYPNAADGLPPKSPATSTTKAK
ncbi:MAG: XRE family transcriptional regulator [Candidatus Symbiopectobacterium sp. Clec_Harlan]|nr:XRE family transcriptional regulator [Candidatus Symbiopectobacterium sp. Clec_Harlan]